MPADNPAVSPPLRLLERPALLARRPQLPVPPPQRWLQGLMVALLRRR